MREEDRRHSLRFGDGAANERRVEQVEKIFCLIEGRGEVAELEERGQGERAIDVWSRGRSRSYFLRRTTGERLEELEWRGRSVGLLRLVGTRESGNERVESGSFGRVEVGGIFGEIEREGEGCDSIEVGTKSAGFGRGEVGRVVSNARGV